MSPMGSYVDLTAYAPLSVQPVGLVELMQDLGRSRACQWGPKLCDTGAAKEEGRPLASFVPPTRRAESIRPGRAR